VDLLNAKRYAQARRVLGEVALAGGAEAPWAVQELVRSFVRRGDVDAAEPALRALLPADAPLLAHGLGYFYRQRGRPDQARRMLASARRNQLCRWPASLELGWLAFTAGRVKEAIRALEAARREFHRRRDEWGEASALTHLATIAVARWRFDDALRILVPARALKKSCGDALGLAATIYYQGGVELHRCRFARARQLMEEALEHSLRASWPQGAIAALNAIGTCHVEVGELTAGARAYLRALALARSAARAVDEVSVEVNLAGVQCLRGDVRSALSHHARAVSLEASAGSRDALAHGAANIATLLAGRGRPQEARRVLDEAFAWRSRLRVDALVDLLSASGLAHLAAHAPDRARRDAREALAQAVRMGARADSVLMRLARARLVLARALAAEHRTGAAGREFAAVARSVEHLLARQPAPALRVGALETCREITDAHVEFLVESEASPRRAWQAARSLKARELRAQRSNPPVHGDVASRRLDEIEAEMRHLGQASGGIPGGHARLSALANEYRRLTTWSAQTHGPSSRRLAPEHVIPRDLAVLEYHVGETRTWCFVATHRSVRVIPIDETSLSLARAVNRLMDPLRVAARSLDPTSHLAVFDRKAAGRLHRRLVEVALSVLPARPERVAIVPSGPLALLPFDLLARCAAEAGGTSTIPTFSMLPSSTLRASPAGRERRGVVAVGWSPPRDVNIEGTRATWSFGPLPRVRWELAQVARLHEDARILSGHDATGARILQHAAHAEIIHVAAHAFSDQVIPDLSGLVLSDGKGGVDLVSARRIAARRLKARLVILSACDTAAGEVRRHEGVLSLARTFLSAGADAVLATLWPVDDEMSSRFAIDVHRGLVRGMDRSTAVASARDAARARAPGDIGLLSWPAFVLIERWPEPSSHDARNHGA
jgi:tetratricopeptide (TPR) repeat protein